MAEKTFTVYGMSCAACSARVEKAVSDLVGVESCQVNLLTGKMTVRFNENAQSVDGIIAAVKKSGYEAKLKNATVLESEPSSSSKTQNNESSTVSHEVETLKRHLIVSLMFSVPLFCITMLPMFTPLRFPLLNETNPLIFSFSQFLLLLPVLFVNFEIIRNGTMLLFRFAPNMNSLISIGVIASVAYGLTSFFVMLRQCEGSEKINPALLHSLYFDSAAMILSFLTLGKFLEAKAKGKTSAAVEKLITLVPKKATVIRNGVMTEIPSEEILAGDRVLLRPGETVPVDGVIVDGAADFDTAAISGESFPVSKGKNDEVISGSININGSVTVQARKVGTETTLAQIIKLVEDASNSKPKIAELADRISLYFVPAIILIAALTFIVHIILTHDIAGALNYAVSVLVVACPCALGLATPTAVMVSIGKAASLGILVKDSQALENFSKANTVIFDKTGTLTTGSLRISAIELCDTNLSENDVLQIAGSVEKYSEHPAARAIVKKMEEEELSPLEISDFVAIPGKGVSAKLKSSTNSPIHANITNAIIYIGNENLCSDLEIQQGVIENTNAQSKMYVIVNQRIVAVLYAEDTVKQSSKEAISRLKAAGLKTYMLSGDNKNTAEKIAQELAVDGFEAELLPAEKLTALEKIKTKNQNGFTAFVGDGINDAPSLASSDIGIALGNGTDIAIESADAVLMRNEPLTVFDFYALSKRSMYTIKQNLFWALFYNSLCIPIAAGLFAGFGISMNPSFAALAMSFSSVTVTVNALRLRRFTPYKNEKKHNGKKFLSEENSMKTSKLQIEGMSCAHCKARVENTLNKISGVRATVDLDKKTATVEHPESVSLETLKKAVRDAGYEVAD